MSHRTPQYRMNRDLFSNHYLTAHLRRTESWQDVDTEAVRNAYEAISDLWDEKSDRVRDYNEAQLEQNVVRPIFEILGIPFEVEETVLRTARRPDYGFFPSEEAANAAFDRENFYEEAIAVADAKRWGRKLDTRGTDERDFENPSYQIHAYLQETPPEWAVLTNGKRWRLYYGPTSHRLDSYYEIDLPELLRYVDGEGDLEDFKDFYCFFRREAFVPDRSGDCFLDDVYDESSVFAEALGEDLQDNIYEAIRVLATGFLETNDDLDADDLELIHDSSLIYLYRLIFVLYAESESRDLLPTDNEIYRESYSLNELKRTVADDRDATQQHYRSWQTELWDRLEHLFSLVDGGSQGEGIPKADLYIPAYNGGLFRTDPDPDDSPEAQFLATHEVGDAYLAEVIDLVTRRDADEGDGLVFVDYSSLDERHLGSIYEGLLEYRLDIADEPLALEDGEYVAADEGDDIAVEAGDVYLRTDAGERKATGSYYTPEYVVEYIVDETLGPLVEEIREDLRVESARRDGRGFADEFAERIFELTVLDPAMGSGHFLVNAVDYLAREIIDAQEKQDRQAFSETGDDMRSPVTDDGELRDINWARRNVAQRCLYGVDLNPLATELAKVSLWLRTLAAEQPLAFLDHHLKTGNSLVGSDIESVLSETGAGTDTDTERETPEGQLTLQQSFDHTRRQALEHVMDRFQNLLAIENETLEDIKEMEAVYEQVSDDPLYRKLLAMANVYTAERFGLSVPDDAYERMASALRDDSWDRIAEQDWFRSAQELAAEQSFFHWELEFPVAFYGEDGTRQSNAGFDAVIGNPPYIIFKMLADDIRDYYREEYDTFEMKGDVYVLFVELASRLLRADGLTGYIVQNKFTKAKYGTSLRSQLATSETIREIIDFHDSPVFDITAYPMIVLRERSEPDADHRFRWRDVRESDQQRIERRLTSADQGWTVTQSDLDSTVWHPFVSDDVVSANTIPIAEFADQIGQGAIPGNTEVYLVDDATIEEYDLEREYVEPVLRGGDVDQFATTPSQDLSQLVYPYTIVDGQPELAAPEDIPNVLSYLEQYRDDLLERKNYGERLVDQGYEWYELRYESPGMVGEKIVFPDISPENRFAYDPTGDLACLDTVYYIVRNDSLSSYDSRYLTAILNSTVLDYLFDRMAPTVRGGYRRYKTQYVEQLPVPSVDFAGADRLDRDRLRELCVAVADGDRSPESALETLASADSGKATFHDCLVVLSQEIADRKETRSTYNLDLLDYLETYDDGKRLADLSAYQPARAVADSILAETTAERENLRIGDLRVREEGGKRILEATARYKPDDPDAHETDRWGYATTEYLPALEFVDLDDRMAALLEEFVPYAAAEGGGFAEFRETATKTNSLLDRIRELTLPAYDDIDAELQTYLERTAEAERLEAEIDRLSTLLNEIVYRLYELEPDEIEMIERATEAAE